jgi:RNA polymerase sigma-70 factor (ECF subfamily)
VLLSCFFLRFVFIHERYDIERAVPWKATPGNEMRTKREDPNPTHKSLIDRLKCLDDQESWRQFVNQYRRLLYSEAIKRGLSDAQADDVVQDTIIQVSKKMAGFRYDPAVDSFRGWLVYLTRKRIAIEFRTVARDNQRKCYRDEFSAELEGIPDPAADVEKIGEEEVHKFIWDTAIARVKKQVSPKHFQMFDLYVLKERPASEVAQAFGVAVAQVYLAKHRISELAKQELISLKAKLG